MRRPSAPHRCAAVARVVQAFWTLTALATYAHRAAADEQKPELGFSADEVDADARMGALVLRGNVVVTYERFRLTSPRLLLRRTPRGIEVDGPGEVVFCPCPSPPVSIAFAGGLVGPPADLVLRHPELRLGGVTIFGLPWFWLRAPTRAGILPPTIAWRGHDGLLAGGGVHFPWRNGVAFDELDLTAAGYMKGGVELTARLRTERSTNRIRWDHLGGDLLAIDARGASGSRDGATLSWDVDAARGSRARSASLQLGDAALPYDRALGETSLRLGGAAVLGVGVRALAPRGGYGPSDTSMWGPRLSLGGGGALGNGATWDALLEGATWSEREGAPIHLARSQAGLMFAARPGWLATRLDLRESTTLTVSGEGSGLDGVAAARGEVSLPLVRAFANSNDEQTPFVNTIEPRVTAGLLTARSVTSLVSGTGSPTAPTFASQGRTIGVAVGGRTTWGPLLGHAGAAVEGDVGAVAALDGAALDLRPLARVRAAWSERAWALTVDGAQVVHRDPGRVWVAKTRVGDLQGWHLSLHGAGRRGADPVLARALFTAAAIEPSGGFLATEGWSVGGEVGARLGASVSAKVGVEEDLESRTLLQLRGAVGYAHPCRCVALDAYAGQRLGREGVDVWVSIDLAPR